MEKKLKNDITTKELQELAKEASAKAIQENFALGLPITVAEEGAIYQVYPNGKKELLKEIGATTVKLNKRKFTLE